MVGIIELELYNDETLEEVASEELVALGLKVEVPQSISLRQARELMILRGMMGAVTNAIDSMEDETQKMVIQNYWEYSSVFERSNPKLIGFAGALGMTDADIDSFFIEASSL